MFISTVDAFYHDTTIYDYVNTVREKNQRNKDHYNLFWTRIFIANFNGFNTE